MFRLVLVFTIFSLLFSSCSEEKMSSPVNNDERVAQLESELSQVKLDNELKDNLVQESLTFFNEIQSNLESIQVKKNEIRIKSQNPELSDDDKTYIIEQIKHINYLREENGKKINKLNNALKDSGLKIIELESLIERLMKEIGVKDQEISLLQEELNSVNSEYSKLFDAYIEQTIIVEELTGQINTGYYTYGTYKELSENMVVEKKDGFIGIGRKTALVDNFNEDYFIKIDIYKKKEIYVEGVKVKFITDHPSTSYTLEKDDQNTKIIITNAKEFWKVSKYLVVIVG